MRITMLTLFAATALLSATALAAAPQVLSTDTKLMDDTNLPDDAEAITGQPAVSPQQAKINNDHTQIDYLQQQLTHDTQLRAARATIKSDQTALKTATKQLALDQKACNADLKASGTKIDPRLMTTMCK